MARTSTGTKPRKKFTTQFAKDPLPPDLDDLNHVLPELANSAMTRFRKVHPGLDRDQSLLDLLIGLMHLCDRDTRFGDFDDQLALAYHVYQESTRTSNEWFNS